MLHDAIKENHKLGTHFLILHLLIYGCFRIQYSKYQIKKVIKKNNLTKDVLIDRIKHEHLFYCSNLVANSCFFISNRHKYHV